MEENIQIDEDKSYTNRLQQMKDIIKLSSIALVLIVWSIIGFISYQNRQLKLRLSQPTTSSLYIQKPSPTPNPIKNLSTYINESCNFEINYPSNWKLETSCYKDDYIKIDCLTSPDFNGNIGIPDQDIKHGEGLTFQCGKTETTNDQVLRECLQDKQKFPSVGLICQATSFGGEEFISTSLGSYYNSHNKNLLTIIILSQNLKEISPELTQILSTLRFNSGL